MSQSRGQPCLSPCLSSLSISESAWECEGLTVRMLSPQTWIRIPFLQGAVVKRPESWGSSTALTFLLMLHVEHMGQPSLVVRSKELPVGRGWFSVKPMSLVYGSKCGILTRGIHLGTC